VVMIWKLKYMDVRSSRIGEHTYTSEVHFVRAASDAAKDIWKTNLTGILPSGRELDEKQINDMLSNWIGHSIMPSKAQQRSVSGGPG
jgi:hypothetical protein